VSGQIRAPTGGRGEYAEKFSAFLIVTQRMPGPLGQPWIRSAAWILAARGISACLAVDKLLPLPCAAGASRAAAWAFVVPGSDAQDYAFGAQRQSMIIQTRPGFRFINAW
jgi:hypothetical protein